MSIRLILSILLISQISFAAANRDRLIKVAKDVANMLENGADELDDDYVRNLTKELRMVKFNLAEEGLFVVPDPIEPVEPIEPDKYICGPSHEIINVTKGKVLADYSYSDHCQTALKQVPNGYICGPSHEVIDVFSGNTIADYSYSDHCQKALTQAQSGYICGPSHEIIDVESGAIIADYSYADHCENARKELVGQ